MQNRSVIFIFLIIFATGVICSPVVLEEFIFLNNTRNSHASTIVELDDSTLAAAWFGGMGEGSDDTKIYFSTKISNSWTTPVVVADHTPQPCWNPVLIYNGSDIILFYKSGPHAYNWSGFIKRSSNKGKTWSSSQLLPGGVIGPAKNKCILVNKNLMCPSSLESHFRDSAWIDLSSDWGLTWQKAGPIALIKYDMVQPTIWISNKNTIRALIRSDSGFIVFAESSDLGLNWETPQLTNLFNPNSGIDAVKLRKSGKIVLMYNNSQEKRTPLNIAVSYDDGETFKNVFTLESDADCQFSYPSIIEDKLGLVHTVYTWICPKLAANVRIKHVVIDPTKL